MGCNSSKELETATYDNSGRKPQSKPISPSSSVQQRQDRDRELQQKQKNAKQHQSRGNDDDTSAISATIHASKPERLYKLLIKAHACSHNHQERQMYLRQALEHVQQEPSAAAFCNPTTQSTPLHLACRLLDSEVVGTPNATPTSTGSNSSASSIESTLFQIIRSLIAVHRESLAKVDAGGHLPLHYAISPTTHFSASSGNGGSNMAPLHEEKKEETAPKAAGRAALEGASRYTFSWKQRAAVVRHLIDSDYETAQAYLSKSNIRYESSDASGPCTPLYRVLQVLPDDMDPVGPSVDYVEVVHRAYPYHAGMGNASDGDKPLGLLYRRFTRQFDISEKFFAGDNSRPMVVEHRRRYKTAAGNTWKCIEILLTGPTNASTGAINGAVSNTNSSMENDAQQQQQAPDAQSGIVHRAVQVETPPDLLRYIVETNAQDMARVDGYGNLPLHYAAATKVGGASAFSPRSEQGSATNQRASYPSFYTKYVIDELLYKFPEAASMPDGNGQYPLSLAVDVGKPWIGGGIKSLYLAYEAAVQHIDLQRHPALRSAIGMTEGNEADSSPDEADGVVEDEEYDAIMLVQSASADVSEVVMSMWAHEEDAGVQMLGSVAISRMAQNCLKNNNIEGVQLLAMTSVAAVVNAMKAHPNEMIVQEKACLALQSMAPADGCREVSMVASGAVTAMIGAMQAHIGDATVQYHACEAVAAIVETGGPDRATVVASVSGVTAIINGLSSHPSSESVQQAGCHALFAMTNCEPRANLPQLPRSQTESILRLAKEQFPDTCGDYVDALLQHMSTYDASDNDEDPNNPMDVQSFPSQMPPASPQAVVI